MGSDQAIATARDRLQRLEPSLWAFLREALLGRCVAGASPQLLPELQRFARRFQQYSAPLREYLTQYPRQKLPGARDVLYWVQEDYTGLKPVLSLVHGVIYQDPARPDRTVVLQKQLYASHYYDGSLAVAAVIGGAPGPAPVTYLVYANRSRGDLLKGGFGGLKRAAANNQAKSAAEQTLGTIKSVLEKGRDD